MKRIFSTCCLASTALLVQLPSLVPTKASSPAVFAVWRRVSGERVIVQAVHDVRNGKLVLSGGTGHRPVLATFRSLVSGHKADGQTLVHALGPVDIQIFATHLSEHGQQVG